MRLITIFTGLLALLALPALAVTYVQDFESGNDEGWTFGLGSIIEDGGNPGAWLNSDDLNTFAPILRCVNGAPNFTGNYVAMGVSRIGGDFRTDRADNGTQYYPFTVLLRNDMGTPLDIEDDIYVYPNPETLVCPQLGEGWTHYDFEIPSQFQGDAGELPEGWMGGSYMTGGDWFPEDAFFTDVMSNITDVEIWWFHPAWFGIFTWWNVGADNLEIETSGTVAVQSKSLSGVKALFD